MEKLKARRAELEVLELKPDLLRRSVELEERKIVIQQKTSKLAVAENRITELRVVAIRQLVRAVTQ